MSANLDIELLRTFHAILRFGRFLAAASHLNRSPSAVSTHVRRLEELAGGRLFERDNQSVRLTPLGQRFQRQTAELLETHDRVLAGLRRREEPLRVRFGISEEYAGKLLGRLLPRLGAELPALELEVLTDASGRLAGRLRRGQLDLALLVQAQDETPYDGHSREIGGTQPVWVAGHGLRLDPQRPLPLALHGQGCPYRQALLEALGATGRRWRTVVSSPGAAALEAAIEGGLAIGVIDRARVGPTMRVLGPAEGFAELPAHRIRLAFAPGERPPALERLGELIAEEFRL
ncbi:LysR family transcriptional regulator [Pseudomonas aeruginosa]|uniref:LysR substrate-binding domain-containing protein n=1 Tax=Pseudomonas aeruginosa TaxID=287 RepID=UPI0018C6CAB5|nr:LysR family transcriptional regulator [Pseudomonas aeruginosa]MBG6745557.1 LysR family transcriptional regulator [Pseudomonas aeruginosa]MBH9364137.1 LysR family transcriptional regulator [Pseudomonas aeruginosa]